MNGAAAVPPRTTSNPSNRIEMMIGANHHFLLAFRKPMNSATSCLAELSLRDQKRRSMTLGFMKSFFQSARQYQVAARQVRTDFLVRFSTPGRMMPWISQ